MEWSEILYNTFLFAYNNFTDDIYSYESGLGTNITTLWFDWAGFDWNLFTDLFTIKAMGIKITGVNWVDEVGK